MKRRHMSFSPRNNVKHIKPNLPSPKLSPILKPSPSSPKDVSFICDESTYDSFCSEASSDTSSTTKEQATTPVTSPDSHPLSPYNLSISFSQDKAEGGGEEIQLSHPSSPSAPKHPLIQEQLWERQFAKTTALFSDEQEFHMSLLVRLGSGYLATLFCRELGPSTKIQACAVLRSIRIPKVERIQKLQSCLIRTMSSLMDIWVVFYTHLILQCTWFEPKGFTEMGVGDFFTESLCYFLQVHQGAEGIDDLAKEERIHTLHILEYIRVSVYEGKSCSSYYKKQSVKFNQMIHDLPVTSLASLVFLYKQDLRWERDPQYIERKYRDPTDEQYTKYSEACMHASKTSFSPTTPSPSPTNQPHPIIPCAGGKSMIPLLDQVRIILSLSDTWNAIVLRMSNAIACFPDEEEFSEQPLLPGNDVTHYRMRYAEFYQKHVHLLYAFRETSENGTIYLSHYFCGKRIEWFLGETYSFRKETEDDLIDHIQVTLLDLICWLCSITPAYDRFDSKNKECDADMEEKEEDSKKCVCSSTLHLLENLQQEFPSLL
jgi:hypothetical protein